MTFSPEQIKELTAKLDKAHVKPPKEFGPKGDYLEGWFVSAEANRIFGFDGWSYSVLSLQCVSERPREIGKSKKPGFGVTYTAHVRVMVDGATREDVGAGHGYDVDAGLAHESAIKEAVTDSLKRCLRTFGNPFGLALYDKERANVEDKPPPPPEPLSEALTSAMDGLDLCETQFHVEEWMNDFVLTNPQGVNHPDYQAIRAYAAKRFKALPKVTKEAA